MRYSPLAQVLVPKRTPQALADQLSRCVKQLQRPAITTWRRGTLSPICLAPYGVLDGGGSGASLAAMAAWMCLLRYVMSAAL